MVRAPLQCRANARWDDVIYAWSGVIAGYFPPEQSTASGVAQIHATLYTGLNVKAHSNLYSGQSCPQYLKGEPCTF